MRAVATSRSIAALFVQPSFPRLHRHPSDQAVGAGSRGEQQPRRECRLGDNGEAAEDGDGVDQPSQKAGLIRIDPRDVAMVCNRATYLTDARYQRCSAIAGF